MPICLINPTTKGGKDMSERRDLIRNVLSSLQGATEEGITISDCGTVSQINVFSGASININVTTTEKKEPSLFGFACHDAIFDDEDRAKIYRMCHGIAKEHGLYDKMRQHMRQVWRAKSMRDLTDTALHELLQYMRKLESEKQFTA